MEMERAHLLQHQLQAEFYLQWQELTSALPEDSHGDFMTASAVYVR